ncbi:MBL fold metallo-hydrolase [Tomitella biformata]|uniref:MBL fold metallo-hydrolase n=1 Tax=Tomitella biformata TaxID=630403 RepID=UPI0004666D2E|nr:MBL fold metallo-hydrolase [Tomitella biformata]
MAENSNRAIDLGDGVYQVMVPFPNPLKHTLVYAMESRNGLVLVDAGWDDDAAWAGLQAGIESIGYSMADIEGVVLTHFHPDHTGLVGRVREASGAWIGMHESDYQWFDLMSEPRSPETLEKNLANLALAGAPSIDLGVFEGIGPGHAPVGPESRPDRILAADEIISLGGRDLRTVWTPGHTPGHVCFLLEEAKTMFTGDHVLEKTTPHVGSYVYPLEEDDALADFMESLRRVGSMDVIRGLGAHGLPIADVAARSAALIEHHEERLAHLYRDFGDDQLTVWQVAERMRWYRPWDELPAMGKQMALSEGAAHLRHLVGRGRVAQVAGTEPALFARVSD